MKLAIVTLGALLAAPPAFAQSETVLKDFFEGRQVVVKIDMPATQSGVDVYADARRPMNFDEYRTRLKGVGVALRSGDTVMVTKIKLKDKLVEFQLGGGGYGTAGDDTDTSVHTAAVAKSSREKSLEREVKQESDAARRRRLENELADLRKEREREDNRNQAMSAAAGEEKKRRIAEQRLHAGSRFNIRYEDSVPPGLTPGGVMAALSEFVDFPFAGQRRDAAPAAPAPASPGSIAALRKGMSVQDVTDLFGAPEKSVDQLEGRLKVTTATFSREDHRLEAEFVEGVLVRYSLVSK
jgi:hypothetical protein